MRQFHRVKVGFFSCGVVPGQMGLLKRALGGPAEAGLGGPPDGERPEKTDLSTIEDIYPKYTTLFL